MVSFVGDHLERPRHPEAPSGAFGKKRKFSYAKGEFIDFDPSDVQANWQYRLRLKAFKLSAWGDKLVEYRRMGYNLIPVALTFRDMQAYIEFERRGGRRMFLKQYKQVCGGRIVDYACVVEFQERGVPHFHYLFVVDGFLRFPDSVDTIYRGLGMSQVGKAFRKVHGAVDYLTRYLRKLKQLSLEVYQQVIGILQSHDIKERLRLYEVGRPDKRGLFTALNKGWVRWLYMRGLKNFRDWVFRNGWLILRDNLSVKADWVIYYLEDKLHMAFMGFLLKCRDGPEEYTLEVASLDDLAKGVFAYLDAPLEG